MLTAWRISKARHPPLDGTGARLHGARWNSPGRAVIYGADTYAGALLEIIAHTLRPRTLPGAHHAVRIEIPDELIEILRPADLPGWESKGSPEAVAFGDQWLREQRSAVLLVPAVPSRPVGHNVLINPVHPDFHRISVFDPFPVPWDDRLF
ncbi:MAG TPA: RES domain-containing protein [Longimicrobium sp.]|nr:RES domain-containing protein [Longimicrobium sp.]